ncbi:ABC transporter permease [Nocardioides insulae]|uniref:ABC transporter permease n=1 Tax=Nocardioides insulae TaxID=394734 RepID=UPI00048FBC9D|nr:ABC transporter permease [Nocardioides insulae]
MRTLVWASLRSYSRRYVAAALAIATGVAFVVVTGLLASSARNGLAAGVEAPYASADSVVAQPGVDVAHRMMAEAGDRATPMAFVQQPVGTDGRQLGEEISVGSVSTVPTLRWQDLDDGRWPRGAGEALVDTEAAADQHVAVGDVLTVGSRPTAVEVRVVGTASSPSTLDGSPLYLTWPDLARFGDQVSVTAVALLGEAPALPEGVEAVPPDRFVNNLLTEINNEVDAVAMMVLLFAGVALFVAVLVIANTFAILFAQRRHDFALLRCLGATPGQIRGSVRVESLLLGVGGSLVGVLGGAGLGLALIAGVRSAFASAPLGAADLSPVWATGAFIAGLLTTMAAAWYPTRQVLRVSPLAALRPDDSASARTTAGRVRVALGIVLVTGGLAVLGWSIAATRTPLMAAGGTVCFLGVLTLGPVLVPPLIAMVGRVAGRALGVPGRIAAANAVRNPRRTAATTAALLVGVTLTAAVLTGLQSTRDSLASEMDTEHPIDLALTGATPLPQDLPDRLESVDGVAEAVAVHGTVGRIADTEVTLLAPEHVDGVVRDALAPAPGTIALPYLLLQDAPDTVTVSVAGRHADLRVTRGAGWGTAALVAPATLADLGGRSAPYAVWVGAEDGADAGSLASDVSAVAGAPTLEVVDGFSRRAWVDLQLDVLAWASVGLLGVGIVIALVGIANTLGLSVLERTRENALLRALGLTRSELRRMLGFEGLLLALVATAMGTVLGIGFAWVGLQVMVEPAVRSAPLSLPWLPLGAALGVAMLAGLLAAVLPARRAARVTPAAGLTLD